MRISLCIIARDEAENLEILLGQMRSAVDEIVVVDTGSRDDRTLQVAARFGARTAQHEWRDDFSAARNAALDLATGDWVVFLDADERLTEAVPGALRKLIGEANEDAEPRLLCPMLRVGGDGAQNYMAFAARIFPRNAGIRWIFPLYEVPIVADHSRVLRGDETPQLVVHHLGHPGDAIRAEEKRERNLRIIERNLALAPNEPSPHLMAGNEYLSRGDHAKAAASFERAVTLAGEMPDQFLSTAYLDLVNSLIHTGEVDRALEYGLRGLTYFPTPELDCAVARAYVARGAQSDEDQALEHFQRARSLYGGVARIVDRVAVTWEPLLGMAYLYHKRGQLERALSCYEEALLYASNPAQVHRHAAAVLRKLGRHEEAAEHLRQALAELSAEGATPAGSDEMESTSLALVEALIGAGETQEAYDYLYALVAQHPETIAYHIRLADLLITWREYDAAVSTLAPVVAGEAPLPIAVYLRLAEALSHLGKYEDAANAFRIALDLDPKDVQARSGLAALEHLQTATPQNPN